MLLLDIIIIVAANYLIINMNNLTESQKVYTMLDVTLILIWLLGSNQSLGSDQSVASNQYVAKMEQFVNSNEAVQNIAKLYNDSGTLYVPAADITANTRIGGQLTVSDRNVLNELDQINSALNQINNELNQIKKDYVKDTNQNYVKYGDRLAITSAYPDRGEWKFKNAGNSGATIGLVDEWRDLSNPGDYDIKSFGYKILKF
jgi:hypothetical protein